MRGYGRALRGEWTKARTLPSTWWSLLFAVAATVALGAAIVGTLERSRCLAPCFEDTTRLSLSGARLGQVGVVVLAVLAVTAEYATRTIGPTVTAMPRRARIVVGKLAVAGGLGLTAGVLAVAGSLLVARIVLPGKGFTATNGYGAVSLGDDLLRRAAVGTVAYFGLVAILSAGIGLLLRDTAGSVTAMLAVLYGAPIVAMVVSDPMWQHRLHRFAPMDVGLSIQTTREAAATTHIGPWAGVGLLATYAAGTALAGLVVFLRRDA